MKWFGWLRRREVSPQNILVPPELQQYYQMSQPVAARGRRRALLTTVVVVGVAVVFAAIVLLAMHLSDSTKTAQPPAGSHAPAVVPGSDKINTKQIDPPK